MSGILFLQSIVWLFMSRVQEKMFEKRTPGTVGFAMISAVI
jgi:hypothetical protein